MVLQYIERLAAVANQNQRERPVRLKVIERQKAQIRDNYYRDLSDALRAGAIARFANSNTVTNENIDRIKILQNIISKIS